MFYEALVHHALSHSLNGTELSEEMKESLRKLRTSTDPDELHDVYESLEEDEDLRELVENLFRDSKDSPMAKFYISFMEWSKCSP